MLTCLKIPRVLILTRSINLSVTDGPRYGLKVKTHSCIDGAHGVPGSFYLNWDIFFKWNAFKITVISCYICQGFNVLWWHQAVDTPSTVWFNDWRVVVNSVTYLLTPSRAAYHEIFTHGSLLSILPISSAIDAPIIPMPMKQPWRIWVFKPQKSNRTHKSNQTKHSKIMFVFCTSLCLEMAKTQ